MTGVKRVGLKEFAVILTSFLVFATGVRAQADAKDWPMYNCDVIGTRHNRGEKVINTSNANKLEEKWRFPAKGSELEIGVITPRLLW